MHVSKQDEVTVYRTTSGNVQSKHRSNDVAMSKISNQSDNLSFLAHRLLTIRLTIGVITLLPDDDRHLRQVDGRGTLLHGQVQCSTMLHQQSHLACKC